MALEDCNSFNGNFQQADADELSSTEYESEVVKMNADMVLGVEIEKLLDEINETEDLEHHDDFIEKLQLELTQKTEELKRVQKNNRDMKCVVNSKKHFISELEQLETEVHGKIDNQREAIARKRWELNYLYEQQFKHLLLFETDVQEVTKYFITAPHNYESDKLRDICEEVQKRVQNNKDKLIKYKQTYLAFQKKFKMAQKNRTDTSVSRNVFKKNINDIDAENKKLKETLDRLKKRIESTCFKVA